MIPHTHSETSRPTRGTGGRRPHVEETTLRTEKIQVERKLFIFTLKENARGRFLRVTEDVNGRRDHIIVPATGLVDFAHVVQELASTDSDDDDRTRDLDEPAESEISAPDHDGGDDGGDGDGGGD
jgi:hypothetical protein